MPGSLQIAVTGATGFIGKHLIRELSCRGHRVIAISRRPVRDFLPDVRQVVMGDLNGPVDWAAFLDGSDVVVHLAGIAHAVTDIPRAVYNQVNHIGTVTLAQAVNRLRARLIFVSSVAAQVGPAANRIVAESDPAAPVSAYGFSKRDAERAIAAADGRYVILRPPLVYGRGVKANMAKLIRLAKLPIPLPFASVDNRRSLLGIDNLTRAIEFLVARDEIDKETFLIADSEPISLPEMLSKLREGMGRAPNLISLPPRALAAVFRLLRKSDAWERLSQNLVVTTDHLRRAGYSPAVSTREGMIRLGRDVAGIQG
jgi:nucleoside-diphosphate-sugar epimerase